jgi:hypothetical protein
MEGETRPNFKNQIDHLEAERQLQIVSDQLKNQHDILRNAEKTGDLELIKKEGEKMGQLANEFEMRVQIAIDARDKLQK